MEKREAAGRAQQARIAELEGYVKQLEAQLAAA